MSQKEKDDARNQARSHYRDIEKMMAALNCDWEFLEELRDLEEQAVLEPEDQEKLHALLAVAGECTSQEEALTRIKESTPFVGVRSGWQEVGEELEAVEFCITLSGGGPAARIHGTLDSYMEPSSACIEYQDWGTPWTEYWGEEVKQDVLLDYCRQFYFGE